MGNKVEYKAAIAIPPGETLKEYLDDINMSQKELAKRTGLTEKYISEIINGKAPISQDTSIKLEYVLEIPASFWNDLELNYQETKARIKAEKDLEDEIEIAKEIPYAEIARLGWVNKTSDAKEKAKNLRSLFSVASLKQVPLTLSGAFRKSDGNNTSSYALAVWLRKGELDGEKIYTEKYNKNKLRKLIPDFRKLTLENPKEFYPKMVQLCASCGIALVLVPHIPKTYACGATQWVNPNKAVVQLSVRGARADIFWFTFFHEIAHILCHEKKAFHLQEQASEICIEDQADNCAREWLIPQDSYEQLINSLGYSNKQSIISFSKQIGVHPCIVVGRLAHDGKITYGQYSDLRPSFTRKKN